VRNGRQHLRNQRPQPIRQKKSTKFKTTHRVKTQSDAENQYRIKVHSGKFCFSIIWIYTVFRIIPWNCNFFKTSNFLRFNWRRNQGLSTKRYSWSVLQKYQTKHVWWTSYGDLRFSRRSLWRMPSSGMWRRVDLVWTDVSEERIASIFRVEKSASEEPAWAGGCRLSRTQLGVFDWWLSLQPPAHAGFSLADFSTLKMQATCSSETSVHTRSTRRHIPEDYILQLLMKQIYRTNFKVWPTPDNFLRNISDTNLTELFPHLSVASTWAASAESGFGVMNRVKHVNRFTMSEERLNDYPFFISILALRKELILDSYRIIYKTQGSKSFFKMI
jgi:hypothetical protein